MILLKVSFMYSIKRSATNALSLGKMIDFRVLRFIWITWVSVVPNFHWLHVTLERKSLIQEVKFAFSVSLYFSDLHLESADGLVNKSCLKKMHAFFNKSIPGQF